MVNFRAARKDRYAEGFGSSHSSSIMASSDHNEHRQRAHVYSRQGQYEPLHEDDACGFRCNRSADFLSWEKMQFPSYKKRRIPEDDNTSLRFEGRHTIVKEPTGFFIDSRYQRNARKLHHWKSGENSMFPSEKHHILRGKSVEMPYHFTRLCDAEVSWQQEQSKKLSTGDLELYRKTDREFSSRKYYKFETKKRVFDAHIGRYREKNFGARHDIYPALGKNVDIVDDFHSIPRESQLTSFLPNLQASSRSANFKSWSSVSDHVEHSNESRRDSELGEFGTKPRHKFYLKSASSNRHGTYDKFHQQKKPRLGWGEGLAKYENQSVDGAYDNSDKNDFIQLNTSVSQEDGYSLGPNVEMESPEPILASSQCKPPKPFDSLTSISLPDEHAYSFRGGSFKLDDCEKFCNNLPSTSKHGEISLLEEGNLPVCVSQIPDAEAPLNAQYLDGSPFAPENSKTGDTFQIQYPSEWQLELKNEILQKLERVECEFDKVEKELGCLNSEIQTENCHSGCVDVSVYCSQEAFREIDQKIILKDLTGSIKASSSGYINKDRIMVPSLVSKSAEARVRNQCFIELPFQYQRKGTEDNKPVMWTAGRQITETEDCGVNNMAADLEDEAVESQSVIAEDSSSHSSIKNNFRANFQLSSKVGSSVLFNSLSLPTNSAGGTWLLSSEVSQMSLWKQNAVVHERNRKQMEEKIGEWKRFLNFKEQMLALKFRILREWWEEEQLILSARKGQGKHHQIDGFFDSVHLPSYQFQSSLPGTLNLVPTSQKGLRGRRLALDVHLNIHRAFLKMPAMTLDDKWRRFSRIWTNNGLVEDPVAVEKERKMINPWTSEEKELFWAKFAIFRKNFGKVASFLEHKTVADCVEFYYKNHKSEYPKKSKARHGLKKQECNSSARPYLSSLGNRRRYFSYETSLDVLGAAVALTIDDTNQKNRSQGAVQICNGTEMPLVSEKFRSEMCGKCDNGRIADTDFLGSETEVTAAADVLAGTYGVTTEAISSCMHSAVDIPESFYKKSHARGFMKKTDGMDPPQTYEADFETCNSTAECHEDINSDWTDNEKCLFINALSKYGKDFQSISSHVNSRTEDQCRTFFCKSRKVLKLDELVSQEPVIEVQRNSAADLSRGLSEMHIDGMSLTNIPASDKTLETLNSQVMDSARQNARTEIGLDEAAQVCHPQSIIEREDCKVAQDEEIELEELWKICKRNLAMVPLEASAH